MAQQRSIRSMVFRVVGSALAGLVIVAGLNFVYGLQLRRSAAQMRAVSLKASRLAYTVSQALYAQGAIVTAAPGMMEVAAIKKDLDAFAQISRQVDHDLAQLEPLAADAELAQLLRGLRTGLPPFRQLGTKVLDLAASFQQAPALECFQSEFSPVARRINADAGKLMQRALNLVDQRPAEILDLVASSNRTATIAAAAVLLLVIGFTLVTVRQGIMRPLQRMTGMLQSSADHTTATAGQVAASSQHLASGSNEQAASLEETSASLEEIAGMTRRNAESAAQAKDLAGQTRTAADTGAADMEEMQRAMAAIKGASDDISKIIKTIDEIAFQTNILALNAAVEAARAGAAGRGFAVVADAVRALAQRAAAAAKETAGKIDDSARKSDHGVHICAKVGTSLAEIVTKARQVDTLVAEIATSSHEQTQGIAQVNTAVSQMDKITQANAATAQESASTAAELRAQAEKMHTAIGELRRLVDGATVTPPVTAAPAVAPSCRAGSPGPAAAGPAIELKPRRNGTPPVAAAANGHHDDFFKDA